VFWNHPLIVWKPAVDQFGRQADQVNIDLYLPSAKVQFQGFIGGLDQAQQLEYGLARQDHLHFILYPCYPLQL